MKKYLVGLVVLSLVFSVFVGFSSISFAQKKYNESPMLTELVKAGKLPSVEQRLPKKPFVVGPGVLLPKDDLDFEIGKYGGIMRLIHHMSETELSFFIMNNEPLVSCPGITGANIQGNIVESYKVSPDWKVFTFKLREGLKWSDGTPVTTEDVQFTYEDFLLNEQLTPVFPTYLRSGNKSDGKPMKLEIIDKYTFRISFDEPYGPSPHGMSWGDTPWEEAYKLPGSRQLGIAKRLLERYQWWKFEPHPEWIEVEVSEENRKNNYHPYCAGIPREVRIIYLPFFYNNFKIKDIEEGVSYRAYLFNPANGNEIDIGNVIPNEDGRWQLPELVKGSGFRLPIYQDWILVLEARWEKDDR